MSICIYIIDTCPKYSTVFSILYSTVFKFSSRDKIFTNSSSILFGLIVVKLFIYLCIEMK